MNRINVIPSVCTKEDVIKRLKAKPTLYQEYCQWPEAFRNEFMDFMMGVRGVKMTYDPFFKHIFNPEIHPERLSELLSLIVGKPLKVKRELNKEHSRITEKGSLMIMDILVEFENGEIGNVEIQKIGYLFPGERSSCYSSDMIMRQYERVRAEKGKNFSYGDLKTVYTIVFMEDSSKEFKLYPNDYVHKGEVTFDTGLKMELLQKYLYIPLDIFRSLMDNINIEKDLSKLEAWIYFIGSDRPEDIAKVIHAYPEFSKMYQEVYLFRQDPEEAVTMFSEALRIMDENTVKLMIEMQKEELKEKDEAIRELDAEIQAKDDLIKAKNEDLQAKDDLIKAKNEEIQARDEELKKKNEEIEKYRKLLNL